ARCNTSLGTATSRTRCDIPCYAQTASMGSGRTDGVDAPRKPAKSILWIAAIPVSHGGASWRGTPVMHSHDGNQRFRGGDAHERTTCAKNPPLGAPPGGLGFENDKDDPQTI